MRGVRRDVSPHLLEPGEYGYWQEAGNWYAHCPDSQDLVANLGGHDVEVNADGTITVSPSILCRGGPGESWHGYLENGVWRRCQ